MEKAPFYNDMAEGPEGGNAFWIKATDGVRLRVGYWSGSTKGTVLLFPGRTEYVEKYGLSAQELADRGYATLVIDWRGQGLADRLSAEPLRGHVNVFTDYQFDVAAMVKAAEELDCPKPYFLMSHSMGGCIALRALHSGLDVKAAAFSAPMWGIRMKPGEQMAAWPIGLTLHRTPAGHWPVPGAKSESYVLRQPFQNNALTTDPDMYAYMQRHVSEVAALQLSAPSIRWLFTAMLETRALQKMAPPTIPALTHLGTNERIVLQSVIHEIMDKWQNGRLKIVEGAEHEIMIEKPAIRTAFFDEADALFIENAR
ncbi:MAG: alpha/beta hydrolase [Paracoccaceae bacterium]